MAPGAKWRRFMLSELHRKALWHPDDILHWHSKSSRYLNLTHWGRETIIGSDNGLTPGRRQAIFWTNAGILLIGPLSTNFSEILIKISTFSFKKMRLKVSSAKWRPCCLGSVRYVNHTIPRNPGHWAECGTCISSGGMAANSLCHAIDIHFYCCHLDGMPGISKFSNLWLSFSAFVDFNHRKYSPSFQCFFCTLPCWT